MINFRDIGNRGRPIVIAHRGANHKKPRGAKLRLRDYSRLTHENTIEAFRAAIEIGADAVEFDLRKTFDGEIIVHHNKWIRGSRQPIREMSLARAKSQAEKRGYEIPTFEETLKFCAGRIALDIEIKEKGFEAKVLEQATRYFDLDNVVFKSFKDEVVREIKALEPKAIAGLLLGLRPQRKVLTKAPPERKTIARVRDCRADFVSPHWRILKLPFYRVLKSAGLPVLVWTVDRLPIAERLIGRGVSGIITDYPEKILPLVKE